MKTVCSPFGIIGIVVTFYGLFLLVDTLRRPRSDAMPASIQSASIQSGMPIPICSDDGSLTPFVGCRFVCTVVSIVNDIPAYRCNYQVKP